MSNRTKYNNVFVETFSIEEESLTKTNVEYNTIKEWDSIGHMTMVAELEDVFDIEMETDDVINFSSYNKGIEILSKYGVQI